MPNSLVMKITIIKIGLRGMMEPVDNMRGAIFLSSSIHKTLMTLFVFLREYPLSD